MIYLDGAANSCGIPFTSTFEIRFQFYDNYSIPTDGYGIDNVQVGTKTILANYVRSAAPFDGYITEFTENSSAGGAYNTGDTMLLLGDTNGDQQTRAILNFNTSMIPDDAIIVKATLRTKYAGVTGTNPFNTHGFLIADVDQPFFGTTQSILPQDFADSADMLVATTLGYQGAGWYLGNIKYDAFQHINKTGITQFRLRFQVQDNDDNSADYLKFYSGDVYTLDSTYYVNILRCSINLRSDAVLRISPRISK